MKKFHLIILFLTLQQLHAQSKAMTLQECIEYAWKNNLDLKQSMLNAESSKIDYQQSKMNQLPNLSFSTGQNYQFGRTIDRFTNTFVNQTTRSNNFGLSSGVMVFNGFQIRNNIKQNKENLESVNQNIEANKNAIALTISNLFLQLIQIKESINNSKLQMNSTLNQIDRAQKLVDAGTTDMSSLLSLKAQLANEELNLINNENSENALLLSLKTSMQFPVTDELQVLMPNIELESVKINETPIQIYESAIKFLPQVKAAIAQNNASNYLEKISRGALLPSISLFANVNTVFSDQAKNYTGTSNLLGYRTIGVTQVSNEAVISPIFDVSSKVIPFNTQIKDNLGQSAGISLSWNLFNGFNTQNQIKKAKINQQISDLNLLKTKNTILTEINTAYNNYTAAQARYKASENNVNAQKTSYEYIQKRFDAGLTSSFDFISAKNNFLIAQSTFLQAKYELVFRSLVLNFYKGNKIAF